jgi:uncharacterized damage-inducible protein DinB
MTAPAPDSLKFPIGKFVRPPRLTPAERAAAIDAIAATPAKFRDAVHGLSAAQLDTPYRPGGWTVRQLVHHMPDSHMNAYVRFKLALTEDNPTIKPYDEALWANLPDTAGTAPETSLTMLTVLHERWVALLRAMEPAAFSRPLVHPDNGPMNLDQLLALYAWHGPHHTAHVTSLRQRMGW